MTKLLIALLFSLSCTPSTMTKDRDSGNLGVDDSSKTIDLGSGLKEVGIEDTSRDVDTSKDTTTDTDRAVEDMADVSKDLGQPLCEPTLKDVQVWLIGDSTVANNSGWGNFLGDFLVEKATVFNRAIGGRSSKSFYDEDNSAWSKRPTAVLKNIKAGDYVLMQFGHNDAKKEDYRHTDPGTPPDFSGSYRNYLELYISETRAEGAIPVVLSSVSRMTYKDGKLRRSHKNYPEAAEKIAKDNKVTFLDLEEKSYHIFNDLGESETVRLYGNFNNDPTDRSHFPKEKAPRVAKMVMELIADSASPLSCYLKK